jgi:hypothetical protein
MKTLQEHYNAINSGQGNKAQFVKQAKNLFPEYFNQYTNYDNAISVLKSKQIISENAGGVVTKGFDIYDWKKILEAKATEKEISKEAADANKNAFQPSDKKNADNVNFNEIMKGFYAELKDEKNAGKTGDEIKAMVVKNLAKDCLYYTKDGMFGIKGVGFTDEAPGLGKNTQPTSKVASVLGGRDEVDSNSDIVKNSLVGATKKVKLKENQEKRELSLQLVDKEDKKGLALYKNTKDQNDLYYYDGEVLYSVGDNGSKGPSVRMSLFNITGLKEDKEQNQKITISGIDKAISMLKSELKNNGVKFETEGNKVMAVNSPKVKMAIKMVKERIGIQSIKLNENTDEGLYQGPSVKIGAGGGLGGKRFIPSVTVLSRDAVDSINAKGAKRLNWSKPHIKIVKSGDGVKLLISKLLVDTIVGSERGRSKLSLSVSKMGTGITPEEMSELSGEFKKLVKVLNTGGKLSQNGDYFLLDVPTKYNEKRNQFEMPLPATVAESGISEGIEEYDNMSDQEIIQWAYDDGFEDFIVYDGEDGLANREEVLRALLGAEDLGSEESEEEMWGPDDIDPAGGYGPSSHMESIAEQKLRSLIRSIIKEEANPNNFELGQDNPEDAPMGVNDKSASKPMKAKVDIKSTLEKIATSVFMEKDLNKAKEIFRSHIENSGINDKDKTTILRNIDATKTKPRLDSYLVNSLLHYEGMGTSQIKEKNHADPYGVAGNPDEEEVKSSTIKKPNPDVNEQKLRSLIRNLINEEINEYGMDSDDQSSDFYDVNL